MSKHNSSWERTEVGLTLSSKQDKTAIPTQGKMRVACALGQVISGYRVGDFKRSVEALMIVIDVIEQQDIELHNLRKEIAEMRQLISSEKVIE